jgi:thiosulfate/3-mercaptopyruvate sulfurtransferase
MMTGQTSRHPRPPKAQGGDDAPPLPLVSPQWLAANLAEPSLRIFDVSVQLSVDDETGALKPESGQAAYEQGHIPGAAFLNLGDLEDPARQDLHMLPAAEAFAAVMSGAGVGPGTHVIAYDTGAAMWATRLWWMLRAFGFDSVSVLDGGLRAWVESGFPLSTDPPVYPSARFDARFRPELVLFLDEVAAQVEGERGCLVSALSPEEFRGQAAFGYPRGGRIPGSVNVPYFALLDPQTARFLGPARLREQLQNAGVFDAGGPVTTYCGNGFAATVVAFALSLLGQDDVAVYDGSLAEWGADPARPLETG